MEERDAKIRQRTPYERSIGNCCPFCLGLVQHGADANPSNPQRDYCYSIIAAGSRDEDTEIVGFLIVSDGDVKSLSENGKYRIALAAAEEEKAEKVAALLKKH